MSMTQIDKHPTTGATVENVASLGLSRPPNRDTNPFATCWTSPGKVTYVESDENTVADVLHRLDLAKGWGALVGPHGSGKSTLLHALETELTKRKRQVTWIHLTGHFTSQSSQITSRSNLIPKRSLKNISDASRPVWFLEGFERLGQIARRRVLWQCSRQQVDIVATLHREASCWPWRLAPIANLAPSKEQIEKVFRKLNEREQSPLVGWQDALHALDVAEGNLREFWFELYSLHEKRRRLGKKEIRTKIEQLS